MTVIYYEVHGSNARRHQDGFCPCCVLIPNRLLRLMAQSHCTEPGQDHGLGNDGFLYYAMYCTHYQRKGTIVFYSGFSQTHKIGNIGIIANFIIPYICTFLLFYHMMLVNLKINVSGSKRMTFQGCKCHWSN